MQWLLRCESSTGLPISFASVVHTAQHLAVVVEVRLYFRLDILKLSVKLVVLSPLCLGEVFVCHRVARLLCGVCAVGSVAACGAFCPSVSPFQRY